MWFILNNINYILLGHAETKISTESSRLQLQLTRGFQRALRARQWLTKLFRDS
jgi:hypothetical protein